MNPLISLVIPVYNVEKYLDKCMRSVLAQTYDNFEAILVDDGSTDSSGRMCDEYAEKDDRVIVYHKSNGGLSDARNFGVEHCNADLVSFIDSDDYVTEDYLEYLWYLMEKYDCKMSCATYKRVTDGKEFIPNKDKFTEVKLGTEKALERTCSSVSACTRLYKKELLFNHPFPVGRLFEDLASTFKRVAECDYVAYSDKQIYAHVQRANSITHSEINEKCYDLFWAADEQFNFISEHFPNIENAAHTRCVVAACHFVTQLLSCKSKDTKRHFQYAQSYLKKHLKYIIKDKSTPKYVIISGLTICMGYTASRILWPFRQKMRKAIRGI